MSTSGTASPTAKPKGRFMIVPLPGKFTRGRWECCDYYTSPSKDHIEFAGKNGMKDEESEATVTSPAPVDNNSSATCIGDGQSETTQCSGEVADEADGALEKELHDDDNITTATQRTEPEATGNSESPPESPLSTVAPEAASSPIFKPEAPVSPTEVQPSTLCGLTALPEHSEPMNRPSFEPTMTQDFTEESTSIGDEEEGTFTPAKDEIVNEDDQTGSMLTNQKLNVSEQSLAPSGSVTPAGSTTELQADDFLEPAANIIPVGHAHTNQIETDEDDVQVFPETLADGEIEYASNYPLIEAETVQDEPRETLITPALSVSTDDSMRLSSAEASTEPQLQSAITQVESSDTTESTDSTIDAEPSQGEDMASEISTELLMPEATETAAASQDICETVNTAASSSSDACASPTTNEQHVAVAKIVQAMDLVKTHLTFAVREEVDTLHTNIAELKAKIAALEAENQVLRQYAPPAVLADLPQSPSPIPPPTPLSTKLSQTGISWSPTTPKTSLMLPQRLAQVALKAQVGLLSGNLHVPAKPAHVPAAQSASSNVISSVTRGATLDSDNLIRADHATPLRKMSSPVLATASLSTPVLAKDALSTRVLSEADNHTVDLESFLSPRHDTDVFSCGVSTGGSFTRANTLEITSVVATPASPSFESKLAQRARRADEFMRNASCPGDLQASGSKEGVARRLFLATSSDALTTGKTTPPSALTGDADLAAPPTSPLKILSLELAQTQVSIESNITKSVATLVLPQPIVEVETNVSVVPALSLTDVATTAPATKDMRFVVAPVAPRAPVSVESMNIGRSTQSTNITPTTSKAHGSTTTSEPATTADVDSASGHVPSASAPQAPLTPTVVLASQYGVCDQTDVAKAAHSAKDTWFVGSRVADAPASLSPKSTTTRQTAPKTTGPNSSSIAQSAATAEVENDCVLASPDAAPQEPLSSADVLTSRSSALTAINIASVTLVASRSSLELLQALPDANSSTA